MQQKEAQKLWLIAPAALMVSLFFLYPLCFSLYSAVTLDGALTLSHLDKAFELYSKDMLFTVIIVLVSVTLLAILSISIAALITLSPFRSVVGILGFLYRLPLFIPFIVAAQMMRTFLASGLMTPMDTISFLGWSGIIITFVWKQLAFSTLLISGAMAALDDAQIRAARNLGASRLRILFGIILPQIAPSLGVAFVLSTVTMMSVLSVPMMIGTGTPTMISADMAFRVDSYGDYHVANALGLVSYLICAGLAWFYLRQSLKDKGAAA